MRCLRRDCVPQRLMSLGSCGSPSPLTLRKDRCGQRAGNGSRCGGGMSQGNGRAGGWTPRQGVGQGTKGLRDEGGNPGLHLTLPVLRTQEELRTFREGAQTQHCGSAHPSSHRWSSAVPARLPACLPAIHASILPPVHPSLGRHDSPAGL